MSSKLYTPGDGSCKLHSTYLKIHKLLLNSTKNTRIFSLKQIEGSNVLGTICFILCFMGYKLHKLIIKIKIILFIVFFYVRVYF